MLKNFKVWQQTCIKTDQTQLKVNPNQKKTINPEVLYDQCPDH
jgi:hypothetical protein